VNRKADTQRELDRLKELLGQVNSSTVAPTIELSPNVPMTLPVANLAMQSGAEQSSKNHCCKEVSLTTILICGVIVLVPNIDPSLVSHVKIPHIVTRLSRKLI
jgi:hypothetical protein